MICTKAKERERDRTKSKDPFDEAKEDINFRSLSFFCVNDTNKSLQSTKELRNIIKKDGWFLLKKYMIAQGITKCFKHNTAIN